MNIRIEAARKDHPVISVVRRCELLKVNRSTVYYQSELKQALKIAKPEIINNDQGSQFTSWPWILSLIEVGIKISMDGKGRCLDNVYIERFWRSIKYEAIHLNEYDCLKQLSNGIKQYINFYNNKRYHQSLNYETPASIYFSSKK